MKKVADGVVRGAQIFGERFVPTHERTVPDALFAKKFPDVTDASITFPFKVNDRRVKSLTRAGYAFANDTTPENTEAFFDELNPYLQFGGISAKYKKNGEDRYFGLDSHYAPLVYTKDAPDLYGLVKPLTFEFGPQDNRRKITVGPGDDDGGFFEIRKPTPEEIAADREYLARRDAEYARHQEELRKQNEPDPPPTMAEIFDSIRAGGLGNNQEFARLSSALDGVDPRVLFNARQQLVADNTIPNQWRDNAYTMFDMAMDRNPQLRQRGIGSGGREYLFAPQHMHEKSLDELMEEDLPTDMAERREQAVKEYLRQLRLQEATGDRSKSPQQLAMEAVMGVRNAQYDAKAKEIYDSFMGPEATLARGHLGGPTVEEMLKIMNLPEDRVQKHLTREVGGLFGAPRRREISPEKVRNLFFNSHLKELTRQTPEYAAARRAKAMYDAERKRYARALQEEKRRQFSAVRPEETSTGSM